MQEVVSSNLTSPTISPFVRIQRIVALHVEIPENRPELRHRIHRPGWTATLWPVLLAATIMVASGRSEVASPSIIGIDKLSHFVVFGLLATLVVRLLPAHGAGWALLIVSVFGIADEWRQSFTPGRFVEFADWVADTLGAATAIVIYRGWPAYRRLLEMPLGRKRAD